MALKSTTLRGNARLEQASERLPSIKPLPAVEDPDAVARIQQGLKALKFLPADFGTSPLAGEALGVFGSVTTAAVIAFQKAAFPGVPSEWDGIVGRKTLAKLDSRLQTSPPGPTPSGSEGSITQTRDDIEPYNAYFTVVDPSSVSQMDPHTHSLVPLRFVVLKESIRWLMFDVRRGGKKFWVGAAVPGELAEFNEAHVFFHPAPGQAGYDDSQYAAFTGQWPHLERYLPWLGTQLAAAKRKQVLFVPYMTQAYWNTLGLLQSEPLARIAELLAAVKRAVQPKDSGTPTLKALGASSFSVGVSCLAKFVASVGASGLLKEAYDFDGLYSNSPHKLIAAVPFAAFKKYSQTPLGPVKSPGFFLAPLPRWKNHVPRPTTPHQAHGLMPNMFFHAASAFGG